MSKNDPCPHWRVICVRDGAPQWEETHPGKHEAWHARRERCEAGPPTSGEANDEFLMLAPTPGAWSPSRRRLPIAGESARDLAVKDALLSEDFGSYLFDQREYGQILRSIAEGMDDTEHLFWTIDMERDPFSVTLQDVLDLFEQHSHHAKDCEDDDCESCEGTPVDDGLDEEEDEDEEAEDDIDRGDCVGCCMEPHWDLVQRKAKAFLRRFLAGRGLRFVEHSCATELQPLPPPDVAGVYFVASLGYLKIGLAKNIRKRMGDLQTNHPIKLTLLAYVETDRLRDVEAEHHVRFTALRESGEWFRLTGSLREYVMRLNIAHRTGRAA